MELDLARHAFYYTAPLQPFSFRRMVYMCTRARRPDYNLFLTYAVAARHLQAVKYLMGRGADVHANEDQAIRWASWLRHEDMVKFLCNRGADINIHGGQPLQVARTWNIRLVHFLIQAGAKASEE